MGEVIKSTASAPQDVFHWISTILSMVLGLGATRLLGGMIAAWRSRRKAPLDWLPLVWGCLIFFAMVQFWWGIRGLSATHTMGFPAYLLLVALIVSLYAACALLLPFNEANEHGSLRRFFHEEGRCALLALSCYFALGAVANIVLFGGSLLDGWAVADIPIIALPVIAFLADRRWQVVLTLAYVAISLGDYVLTASYG